MEIKNTLGQVLQSVKGDTLEGADLRGADLEGAYLRGANLRGANLFGAGLRGADLQDANLGGTDFWGANLRGTKIRGADIRGTNFMGADLQNTGLTKGDLTMRHALYDDDTQFGNAVENVCPHCGQSMPDEEALRASGVGKLDLTALTPAERTALFGLDVA